LIVTICFSIKMTNMDLKIEHARWACSGAIRRIPATRFDTIGGESD
jgi:hypothetical protein